MRVKRGFKAKRRRKKILKLAKGHRGGRSKLFRTAADAVDKALMYAYRDRKARKRDFRRLWITRINAAARMNNLSYSKFSIRICSNRKSDIGTAMIQLTERKVGKNNRANQRRGSEGT